MSILHSRKRNPSPFGNCVLANAPLCELNFYLECCFLIRDVVKPLNYRCIPTCVVGTVTGKLGGEGSQCLGLRSARKENVFKQRTNAISGTALGLRRL
jgi:hypothetical protein